MPLVLAMMEDKVFRSRPDMIKLGELCSVRLVSLVSDGALDGSGHDLEQLPVAGGDYRLGHVCHRGVHNTVLQPGDQIVVQRVLRSTAVHERSHFVAGGLNSPPVGHKVANSNPSLLRLRCDHHVCPAPPPDPAFPSECFLVLSCLPLPFASPGQLHLYCSALICCNGGRPPTQQTFEIPREACWSRL